MSQLKQRANSLFCLFVTFRPSKDWMITIYIAQSNYSNARLFQKHSHRHSQQSVLTGVWESLSPVKQTHKTNHHSLSFGYEKLTFFFPLSYLKQFLAPISPETEYTTVKILPIFPSAHHQLYIPSSLAFLYHGALLP